MGLYFHNEAGSPISLVYGYSAPECEGGVTWAKKGWYNISPGGTAKVWSGWAGGETFYYFAHDAAGREWSGEFFTQVPSTAFDWCWNTGSTASSEVGFRKKVVEDDFPPSVMDYTVNLIP